MAARKILNAMKQSTTGTITFFSFKNGFLFEKPYHSIKERQVIIQTVVNLYGKNQSISYQIAPDVSEAALEQIELPGTVQSIQYKTAI